MSDQKRVTAALRALDGLSVGDAFGECFFYVTGDPDANAKYLSTQTLPDWRWRWTDDTAMAISVVEILIKRGWIDQDDLARAFATRYAADDQRGYGGTAHGILRAIHGGADWITTSSRVLGGMGSMGNGGAMRVAPLGAFFADDVDSIVEQARRSAEVTHAHPEGQSGAIAVALAAAFMARTPVTRETFKRSEFFDFVLAGTPDGLTRAGLVQARDLPSEASTDRATSLLGNGLRLIASDTVPFCVWCAAKFPCQYESAMWATVSGSGDMDTNCAIVGGIIAASEEGKPPAEWLGRREPLPWTRK